MNLLPLFAEQQKLRDTIIKNHKLQDHHLFKNFIVAFQCELYELVNEWRGFKHWSKNREMNKDAVLEEFADCMAFLLELGIELKVTERWDVSSIAKEKSYTIQQQIIDFNSHLYEDMNETDWIEVAEMLFGLGQMLGFTDDEMINAYYEKLKINHQRQATGY